MLEENKTIKFNDTILFIDKITYVTKSKQTVRTISDKLRTESGIPIYTFTVTVFFDNGNFVEFENLDEEDVEDLQNLITQ